MCARTTGQGGLFTDQYCALILMSLFSPMIQSLRDLQRACALDKVRKRLGVTRASLGSDKHNGVEIQAYCAMIVCMLILIYTEIGRAHV